MPGRRKLPLCLAALLLVGSASAGAHPLAPSLLALREHPGGLLEVRWKTPRVRVPGSRLEPRLPAGCRPERPGSSALEGSGVVRQWWLDCGAEGLVGRTVGVDGIASSRADVVLRIELADGRHFGTVLRAERDHYRVPRRQSVLAVGRSYARLGTEHILTGTLHLLFVLGLVLLVRSPRELLATVTAFTLGHSVTLSLAALGWAVLPSAPIEVGIAASVFAVGVEAARAADGVAPRAPALFAGGFGLLHGMGFAGALAEVGLPPGEALPALFAFNLGVEAGQLLFVAAILTAAQPFALRGRPWPRTLRLTPAYCVGSLAALALFQRLAVLAPTG